MVIVRGILAAAFILSLLMPLLPAPVSSISENAGLVIQQALGGFAYYEVRDNFMARLAYCRYDFRLGCFVSPRALHGCTELLRENALNMDMEVRLREADAAVRKANYRPPPPSIIPPSLMGEHQEPTTQQLTLLTRASVLRYAAPSNLCVHFLQRGADERVPFQFRDILLLPMSF
jgi:hypothetical protein